MIAWFYREYYNKKIFENFAWYMENTIKYLKNTTNYRYCVGRSSHFVRSIDAAIFVMKQWTVLFLVAGTQLTFCFMTNLKRLTATVLQTVLQAICYVPTFYLERCNQTRFVECFVVLRFYGDLWLTVEDWCHGVRQYCQNDSGRFTWKIA